MKTKQTIMAVLFSIVLVCGILFATKQENTYTSQMERDNVEALTSDEFNPEPEFTVITYSCTAKFTGVADGKFAGLNIVKVDGGFEVTVDGGVRCQKPGNELCRYRDCVDVWRALGLSN